MNILLHATLVTAAAVASVVSNSVPEVATGAKVPDVAEVEKVAKLFDVEEFEYDEYGVPLRTVPDYLQNLSVGVVGPDDRLISRTTHGVAAASFIIHDQDITINGAKYTNITSVQVARVGNTQNAIPTIKAGGLGHNFVTINILGVRGRGFDYTISVYSSIGCPKTI